jgi:arylformamidase
VKIIDLTHDITNNMGVFPGDPACRIITAHAYENGYFVSEISMGTHTGTHVDTPVHKLPGAASISELGIAPFISEKNVVIDARGLEGEIDAAFIAKNAEMISGRECVIFRSGWADKFGTDGFFNGFPALCEDAAPALKKLGVRIVGLETPSVNPVRHASVHDAYLREGMIIVEALANVGALPQTDFSFYAAPLKLKGRDGSPVRAFATVLED